MFWSKKKEVKEKEKTFFRLELIKENKYYFYIESFIPDKLMEIIEFIKKNKHSNSLLEITSSNKYNGFTIDYISPKSVTGIDLSELGMNKYRYSNLLSKWRKI